MVSLQTLRGVGVACATSWARGGIVELMAECWLRLAHMTVLLGLLFAACSVVFLN
jgi:hypothetical protein